MAIVGGHGALEKEKTLAGRVRKSKLGWLMVMGPLKRKKTLAGKVRVFTSGWLMAMGPLKKEQDSVLECQGV